MCWRASRDCTGPRGGGAKGGEGRRSPRGGPHQDARLLAELKDLPAVGPDRRRLEVERDTGGCGLLNPRRDQEPGHRVEGRREEGTDARAEEPVEKRSALDRAGGQGCPG